MAKFIKTVDLWNSRTIAAINSGKLVLQVGQWVQCGSGKKSRFVGVKNGVFDVVHYPRTNTVFVKRSQFNKLGHYRELNMLTFRAFRLGQILINSGLFNIKSIIKCLFEAQWLANANLQIGFVIGNLLINDSNLINKLNEVK